MFTPLRKTLWLSWMQLASGKRLPFACELPEACRGIIRLGFSSWNWLSVSSDRQKNLNCKEYPLFRQKKMALQLWVPGNDYAPLWELVSSLSGSEILILSRSCSRPAFRAKSTAKSSYRALRTGSFPNRRQRCRGMHRTQFCDSRRLARASKTTKRTAGLLSPAQR